MFKHSTFRFPVRVVVRTRGNGHLYGRRWSKDGAVVVIVEADALLLGGGEDSAGHHLRSFLDLIQEGFTDSCADGWRNGDQTKPSKNSRDKNSFDPSLTRSLFPWTISKTLQSRPVGQSGSHTWRATYGQIFNIKRSESVTDSILK